MKWPFLDEVPNSSKMGHFIEFYMKLSKKGNFIKKHCFLMMWPFFDDVAIS